MQTDQLSWKKICFLQEDWEETSITITEICNQKQDAKNLFISHITIKKERDLKLFKQKLEKCDLFNK